MTGNLASAAHSIIPDDSRHSLFKPGMAKQQTPVSPRNPSPGSQGPPAYTPRKYLKILAHVLKTLVKHHAKLSVGFLGALKDLEVVLNQAAHPYSSSATGKLHYYLMEDIQLQQLQRASDSVCQHIRAAANMTNTSDPDFQDDLETLAEKLSGASCVLPASQLHLIDAFRSLCQNMDPAYDIPDGVQKAAEQVVREVIKEVHGPFFNSEILEREVGYLVRIAARIDPNTQRMDAATVKLLASTLLNLDGDESEDEDFDVPGAESDPFLIPSFPPTLRVLDPGTPSGAAVPESMKTVATMGKTGSTNGLAPYEPRFASVSANVGRTIGPASATALLALGIEDSKASLAMSPTSLVTTSQFVTGNSPFRLDLDAALRAADGAMDSTMSSPTPSAASLAAAAAYEQQQLQEQGLYWYQQQQQQQQHAYDSRLPPRSPRHHQQQHQQQMLHSAQGGQQWRQQQHQQYYNTPSPRQSVARASRPGSATGQTPAAHHAVAAAANLGAARYQQDHHQQQQLLFSQLQQQQQWQQTCPSQLAGVGGASAAQFGSAIPGQQQEHQQQLLQQSSTDDMDPASGTPTQASEDIQTGASSTTTVRMLKDFMDNTMQSTTRDSKAECTFHANMKLLDEGVNKLASFIEATKRVRGLSLAHNSIGPLGAQRLCQAMLVHRTVQSLDLPDNCLGDVGAIAIADLLDAGCKVTTLQLSDNGIGDAGMIRLAQAIQRSGYVERLSVYNNRIGPAGCRALTEAVKSNRSLKMVEFLPGNCATTRDIKLLAKAVKQNRKFKLMSLFTNVCMQA